ncbi:arsenate reductase (glutaredoxin) [Leptobacterium sp. I13]|uniref:arsenate reductase (glutaredoxin) n=1 Tax=Leptobacterium meishanense TaxID=3128904 RepID=UPI0030EDB695
MIKIYHNPRCRKSREGLAILKASGKPFETVLYLDSPPSENELKQILGLLGIKPEGLLRKSEAIWKEKYKGKTLDDNAIIQAMTQYPKLIERPVVINGNKAIIGRPPEKINEIL